MAQTLNRPTFLSDLVAPRDQPGRLALQVLMVLAGIAVLALAAKIRVPMWPVPMTMGTFAVLAIGAGYGPRLGMATILGYMAVGALGFDVFAGSSAETAGIAYMMGTTGGYLVGYVLAVALLGAFARAGGSRSVGGMVAALLVANLAIYVPGLLWLHHLVDTGLFAPERFASAWEQTLAWGLTPFLVGDAVKLMLAALLVPGLWRLSRS